MRIRPILAPKHIRTPILITTRIPRTWLPLRATFMVTGAGAATSGVNIASTNGTSGAISEAVVASTKAGAEATAANSAGTIEGSTKARASARAFLLLGTPLRCAPEALEGARHDETAAL